MRKGFTLIELLAVILILGIIALIAIPTITSIIKEAKVGAFKSTASNYIKALEDKCAVDRVKNEATTVEIDIRNGVSTKSDILKNIIKGEIPDQVLMKSDEECQISMALYNKDINTCTYKLANEEEIKYADVANDYRCILDANIRDDKDMYTLGYDSTIDTGIVPTDASCFTFNASSGVIYDYKDDCPKDVIIPAYIDGHMVTRIGYQAFMKKKIESVLMPETITTISNGAFSYNNITTIGLSTQMQTIGNSAFAYNKLTEIILPDSLISTYGFNNNELVKVTFGSEITEICSQAFFHNLNLKELDFSRSINLIKFGISSFEQTGLKDITLPSSLKVVDSKAFRYTKFTSITFPESIEEIGSNVLLNVPTLTEINIVGKSSLDELTIGHQWNGTCNNINFIN